MTRFEVVRSITGADEFSRLMYEMAAAAASAEQLSDGLQAEITQEGMLTIQSVARSGNYPLSLGNQ